MSENHHQDPLGTPSHIMDIEKINPWGSLPSRRPSDISQTSSQISGMEISKTVVTDSLIIHTLADPDSRRTPSPPLTPPTVPREKYTSGKHFDVDHQINEKIAFWCGRLSHVQAEGIVSACSELMSEEHPEQTRQLIEDGGPDLGRDLFKCAKCSTGQVIIVKGHLLPIRYLLLTAGPRYKAKFRSAAENSLFSCYRNSFNHAVEKKIDTLAIGKLHTATRNYPPQEAVHMALRVTRRYLEKHKDSFRKICFVLENSEDLMYYQELCPLYFPRNSDDYYLQDTMPDNIGGEYGEPRHRGDGINVRAYWSTSETSLAKKLNVKQSPFSAMQTDPDTARREEYEKQPDIYNQLLRWARTEDLSEVARCRAVYHSGIDYSGCPVVVCIGKHFPQNISEHKVLSHCVQVMDPVTAQPYVLVYFHTACTGPRNDIEFMQKMFANSPAKFKTNLKAMYNIHPSRYQKLQTWWFTTTKVKEVKGKIQNLASVKMLFDKIDPAQLQVPQFVLDYDYEVNGSIEGLR